MVTRISTKIEDAVGFIIVLNGISNRRELKAMWPNVGFIIVLNGISNQAPYVHRLRPVGFIIVLNGISNHPYSV